MTSTALLGNAQTLMPLPASLTPGQGRLIIDAQFRAELSGYREPRLEAAVKRLAQQVARRTGIPLRSGQGGAALVVDCKGASEPVQTPREDESYTLDVTPQQARLTAATPLGVLRGLATFLQLIRPEQDGFAVPAVRIEDRPRFSWRGLLIDVGRHWMPMEVIRRNLDGMAALKFNVLHLHLSDDQGFRIESKRFPRLHEMGSDGDYFTQDQMREIIAYARDRGIRVLPEFDMPGHTTAWFAGYPDLASGPGPYQIDRTFGVHDACIDPTREETYQFLDGFIGEMAALFPDPYFHIGGDEVNGKQWDQSARIQEFKRAHHMQSNVELQAYFNQRLLAIVQKHGKKMVGWDEIFQPTLPKDIVVHSWRGQKSLGEAARAGYQGILSFGYYLDLMQPASYHYSIDPLGAEAASLTPEQQKLILGGEACIWTEYDTPENIDGRIWPRAAAIAERLWSPENVRDPESMYQRLAVVSRDLDWLPLLHRVNARKMLERLAGDGPAGPVKVLADVVEPVKGYAREEARHYTQFTPLNRLVDAVPPESDAARQFGRDVDALLAGDAAAARRVMERLVAWRDNDARLKPLFERSFLLREEGPLSADLAALARTGLEAMVYLSDKGERPPAGWREKQQALIEAAKKPRAELLLMVAPAVEKLVAAVK